ncbi:MAG: efflux RND transporter periplasmic adaptor subunit [Gemmatimonadaceae bacterium]|jgi:RND family efflux transporter MFP subunit|nr:efflux RND transporter periplasmic adaptor subunit [Gemmatimonadaceae bacterium]
MPRSLLLTTGAATLVACAAPTDTPTRPAAAADAALRPVVVRDTTLDATLDVAAIAAPWQQATVSTKLMGTVTAVLVHVGDRVTAGAPLATIDARDLDARGAQAGAALAAAEASRGEAQLAVTRLRALVAEEAAPRAQLDAAEAALARAEGAVRSADAMRGELAATRSYGSVRAPFAGIVAARHADPGAFAAPGAPLVTLLDDRALRLVATLAPGQTAGLRAGQRVRATVEGIARDATIEGVAPAPGGGTWTVTARVDNADGALAAGGSARLRLPQGTLTGIAVPEGALVRDGGLVGVRVPVTGGSETRWLRLGRSAGGSVEVLGGLRAGDTILVRATAPDRE